MIENQHHFLDAKRMLDAWRSKCLALRKVYGCSARTKIGKTFVAMCSSGKLFYINICERQQEYRTFIDEAMFMSAKHLQTYSVHISVGAKNSNGSKQFALIVHADITSWLYVNFLYYL